MFSLEDRNIIRDYALQLACLRRKLLTAHGRGFDDLPADISNAFSSALVSDLTRDDLLRALGCVIDGLLLEIDDVRELAIKVKPQLLELASEWGT